MTKKLVGNLKDYYHQQYKDNIVFKESEKAKEKF